MQKVNQSREENADDDSEEHGVEHIELLADHDVERRGHAAHVHVGVRLRECGHTCKGLPEDRPWKSSDCFDKSYPFLRPWHRTRQRHSRWLALVHHCPTTPVYVIAARSVNAMGKAVER